MSVRVLIVALSLALQAQEEPPTFRAGASDVRVDAQVSEGARLINSLTKDDFRLTDNGRPQPITYFGHDREPVTLLLLLDVSGSMSRYLEQLTAASRAALRQLKDGDTVGIMVFSRNTRVHAAFTADRDRIATELKDAIGDRSLGSGTQINLSLLDAAKHIADNAPATGRRAILIVTDNLGLNYQAPDADVLRALHDANIVCNAIVVGRSKKAEKETRFTNPDFTYPDVFKLSEQTGGDALKSDKAGEAFAQILERIRSRYSLFYLAPTDEPGKFHEISLDLTPAARQRNPAATLRFRKGYYTR